VAVVISHVLTRMGQHVSKAREMGSYHVGELLGKGGMGEVYRATHRMLARPAAIKLIRPDVLAGDAEFTQLAINRFKREAEIAASLQSPHTVVLYDFGVTEDQSLYFVMELLEGMNLEQLVRQHGPLPAGRTIFLLQQVCESLEEAHARGLVHRDIKPANIHVGRLGLRHDFVKVLDFGLAKSVRSNGRGETAPATAAGVIPGTPEYMAPEMTTGNAVDGRADIYALGCVAYYMLTGQQVFEAANVFHMISRHLNDQPVPPSQRSPQPIPAGLEQVVLDCLAKAPEHRPASASELASALAAVNGDTWSEDQAEAWWKQQVLRTEDRGLSVSDPSLSLQS
jgi:serine/threonine-protein kinase